jgi:hypothetical protein
MESIGVYCISSSQNGCLVQAAVIPSISIIVYAAHDSIFKAFIISTRSIAKEQLFRPDIML